MSWLTKSQSFFWNRLRVEQEIRLLRVSVGVAAFQRKDFLVSAPGCDQPAGQTGECVVPAVAVCRRSGLDQQQSDRCRALNVRKQRPVCVVVVIRFVPQQRLG